ncbi:MAG: glutathione S-transferase family protein [Rhodocyclaceae bacterium]|nr:glutathione S-transferase family protein [Rhodocyclaceae bacterium]
MAEATLSISSKNYSSWSLRGWLLCQMAGLDIEEVPVPVDDPNVRAELLLLSPSYRVPLLQHAGVAVWDTLSIAEYLHEIRPKSGLLPKDVGLRAHCRSICGEMHSGFANLRSALPMNLRAHYPQYKVWAGARGDIERIAEIWNDCLAAHGGPFLYGAKPNMADAMFAPVATRFATYDVTLPGRAAGYVKTIMQWPLFAPWLEAARGEPEQIDDLDMEF